MVFHMPKFSKSGRKVNDDSEDKTYYSKRGLDSDVPEDKGYYQKSATGTWKEKKEVASSELIAAASAADLEGVIFALEAGAKVEKTDDQGSTALHHAATVGSLDIVKELLKHGAPVNCQNSEGDTALHKAACFDNVEVLLLLARSGAELNLQNLEGWTALHEAACNGNVAVFQHLVHLGANIELVTAEGDTVLHKAARWGRTEVVALLLTVGADTNAVDQLGRRPVDRTNEPCIIKMLHEFEAHHQGGGGGQSSRPQPQARPSGEAPRRTSQAGEQPQKSRWEGEGPGQGRWQQKGGPGGQSSSSDNGRSQQRYEQPSPPQTPDLDAAAQREEYDVRWVLFSTNTSPDRKITYADVAWPTRVSTESAIKAVIFFNAQDTETRRKRLRAELLRWHPDKFQAHFGRFLVPEDSERIVARVKETSQFINLLNDQI